MADQFQKGINAVTSFVFLEHHLIVNSLLLTWGLCFLQVAKIVKGFTDPSVLATGGLYLGGVKYLSISPDPAVIRGKKGQDGVTVKKTVSALVIGIYGEGVQPADGNIVVENLADYLTNTGI